MAENNIVENHVESNNIVSIGSVPAIIYKDRPVVTTKILADLYGSGEDNIRQNFSRNRSRFVEGKHFFFITGDELRELKNDVTISHAVKISPRVNTLTAWTDRGAARHAKMLDTDKAWDVFELLEENYFNRNRRPTDPVLDGPITPAMQQEIKEIVQAKASAFPDSVKPKVFSQIWMRLQRKFKIPRYSELPISQFGEARDYIINMSLRNVDAPALPPADSMELMDFVEAQGALIKAIGILFNGMMRDKKVDNKYVSLCKGFYDLAYITHTMMPRRPA